MGEDKRDNQAWSPEEQLFTSHDREGGGGHSGRRYFGRGGVKFALLELLKREAMHGYQMMKQLEEQSSGTYKPSAGSIYPTLQMLRDQGFVESYKEDGKKIFAITEEGLAYLKQEESGQSEGDDENCRIQKLRAAASDVPSNDTDEAQEANPAAERPYERKRRLTPAGREFIHLLRSAEKVALLHPSKASDLRSAIEQLKHALRKLTEEGDKG
ncbi:PadR family transcriptional regulator [Paenibacillus sp. HB172176]|uniref:PadR family transcriptional regulator n=1 Tax=Paenibacillus sp. HB172176 TaxID=2493690 RepID=UPI00143C7B42|nr:PadR family transcriptional regulator [Paenibacillus sp. HB172176]